MSRIEIYKKVATYTWDATALLPLHYSKLSLSYVLGKQVDTASFKLHIINKELKWSDAQSHSLDYDDRVKIYQWDSGDWDSLSAGDKQQAFAFDGTMSKIPAKLSVDGHYITITASSLIESMLTTPVFLDETAKTVPQLIQQALNNMNAQNTGRFVYWHSGNPTTKDDDSAFPTHNYFKNYTPVVELIESLSSNKYTEDGNYIYYIYYDNSDDKSYLKWLYKPSTLPVENILAENAGFKTVAVGKNKDDVINLIIAHLGKDAHNNSITGFNFNASSIAKNGQKTKYLTNLANTADDLLYQEAVGKGTFDFEGKQLTSRIPNTFPYTFTVIGSDVVSNSTEFNDKFREYVKIEGRLLTQRLIDTGSYPRYSVKFTMSRRNNRYFQLGFMSKVTIPSYGLTNKLLRVHKVMYDQYNVSVELLEDEETAKASGGI